VLITYSWLRIGSIGRFLWRRYWTFSFHKRRGNSFLAEQLSALQEEIWSMELVKKMVLMPVPMPV